MVSKTRETEVSNALSKEEAQRSVNRIYLQFSIIAILSTFSGLRSTKMSQRASTIGTQPGQ